MKSRQFYSLASSMITIAQKYSYFGTLIVYILKVLFPMVSITILIHKSDNQATIVK